MRHPHPTPTRTGSEGGLLAGREKARELDTTEGVNFITNGRTDTNKSLAWLAGKCVAAPASPRPHPVPVPIPALQLLPRWPRLHTNSGTPRGIGRIHDFYAIDPAQTNAVQRAVTRSSRFGIGAIMGEECTHGYQKDGHTMFPAPIASAASFDTELLRAVGGAMGTQPRTAAHGPQLPLASAQ